MHDPLQLWSIFVTFLVTIGPVETAAVFAGLTTGIHRQHRIALAFQSVAIGGAMLLVFALAGNLVLLWLHVSLPAFQIAGGILLFLQALSLTFAKSGLSTISEGEQREALKPGSIAVFPLAFPVIASPGSLSAAVLLTGRAGGFTHSVAIVCALIVCLALTLASMLGAERLSRWLGETGTDVVSRISGVFLAGLAVQFVIDGLAGARI
jgi:multiple antibiotic resistance protein